MKPGPHMASKMLLESIPIDAPPRPIVEWLTRLIVDQGWETSQNQAREVAERWAPGVERCLRTLMSDFNALGRPLNICFNSSSSYLVQGACFLEPFEAEATKASKLRRTMIHAYHDCLADLSPVDFEMLCCGILDLLGADSVTMTPSSRDDGIDFYGKLSLSNFLFPEDVYPSIQRQLSVWLVGQSKRYAACQVATPQIRELVGSVALAIAHTFGTDSSDKYADLAIRPCDPVFHLFFTTGTISRDGWNLLRRSGVVGLDGEMVAAFLADRSVGIENGYFAPDHFRAWLSKYRK